MDDEMRAYLHGQHPEYPPLSNLVARWDQVPDDENRRMERTRLVQTYWAMSRSQRWAWEALAELLRTLREREEPIPASLANWAFDVVVGPVYPDHPLQDLLRRPPAPSGRPSEDERDVRIDSVFRALRKQGVSRKQAVQEIGQELHLSPSGVASVLRKIQAARDGKGP